MIRAEGVSFSYGDGAVLDRVDLTVADGEFAVVVGPNAAGKTTLLRIAAGSLTPLAGRVEATGGTVLLPQEVPRPTATSVMRIVMDGRLAGRGFVFDGEEDVSEARRAMARVGVSDLSTRDAEALSGGEWRRVLLARVLAAGSRNLLLDEPTSHLDMAHAVSVMRLLREEASAGRAVLVVLHDLTLAAQHADRIVIVSGGRVAADGAPSAVLGAETLKRVWDISAVLLEHRGRPVVLPVEEDS